MRVLIVDDSVTIRAMLEQVISADFGCRVVGVAANADAALSLMRTSRPDVVTLDLTMPGMGGLQFLRDMHGKRHPPIIVVSSASTAGACKTAQALEAGAAACFDKARLLTDMPRFMRKLKKAAQAKACDVWPGSPHGRADGCLDSRGVGVDANAAASDPVLRMPNR